MLTNKFQAPGNSLLTDVLWSRITKYICSSSTPNLLSVLDPGSPPLNEDGSAYHIDTQAKQFAC